MQEEEKVYGTKILRVGFPRPIVEGNCNERD